MTQIIPLVTIICLGTCSIAHAQSIAVNFMADSWGGGPFQLAHTETVGIFPQQNWNNADVINGSTDIGGTADVLSPLAGSLVDNNGNATSVSMTWYADKDAGSDGDANTADERLMRGFLEGYGSFTPTGYAVRVDVANVPYGRYKVVPYLIGFGFDATASVGLNGEKYYYEQSSNFTIDGYVQATATSLATAQLASYAVFDGQTQDSFTLDIITEDGNRGALAGIQIISTPIPVLDGDLDEDGFIDASDAGIMFGNWGPTTLGYFEGNLNEDGFIDAADAGIMFANWTGDVGPPAATIPEPSSLLLASLVGLIFGCPRRRI